MSPTNTELHYMATAIARRIAKRQNGERYEGFESSHWEAAKDYAAAVVTALAHLEAR